MRRWRAETALTLRRARERALLDHQEAPLGAVRKRHALGCSRRWERDDAKEMKASPLPSCAVCAVVALVMATAASGHQAGAADRTFRGNGGKALAPFRVSQSSTLYWANNGGIFQIFPSGGSLHGSVNSQGSRGWTYLPPGRYALQINAIGDWMIRIAAGTVRPSRVSGGRLSYSGNGGMELPPFRIPRSEQLSWQARGGIFQIFSSGGFSGVTVNSQASKGTTYARAGVQQLQINTTGAWSIARRA